MMKWAVFNMVLSLLLLVPLSASAQRVHGTQVVQVELVSDATDLSKPFTVGIRFTIEPDWYLYWKNPGDSGLPIEVEWNLPKGWTVEEMKHPVPQKFAHDNVVSYGYKNEVVLLATISPKRSARPSLSAKLDWLVCKESCIRGKATVSLDLKNINRSKGNGVFEQYRQKLPRPRSEMPIVFEKATAEMDGVGLRIAIPFKVASTREIVDFYPASVKGVLIDFASVRVEGGKLVFRGTLEGTGTGEIYLSGLLIDRDGKGYECSVPVQFATRE